MITELQYFLLIAVINYFLFSSKLLLFDLSIKSCTKMTLNLFCLKVTYAGFKITCSVHPRLKNLALTFDCVCRDELTNIKGRCKRSFNSKSGACKHAFATLVQSMIASSRYPEPCDSKSLTENCS